MSTETTSRTLTLETTAELEETIVGAVTASLRNWLREAQPGQCGRLDDLPAPLMSRVGATLHAELGDTEPPRANIRLLVSGSPAAPWQCEWTEAVRLRNLDETGRKRPPLLLLVPPGTELLGSLDVDTFQAIPCGDIVRGIVAARLRALPPELGPVRELLRQPDLVRSTTELQRARYILTLARNGYSRDAAGLALCLLGLWPHRDWLAVEEQRSYWLTRNREIVESLREGTASLLKRIYDLELESTEQAHRLYELLASSASLEAAAEQVATDPAWQELELGHWRFKAKPNTVVITLDKLDLPEQEDGYKVLRVREQPYLPVSWTTEPTPLHVPQLTHFVVEFISTTGEGVEIAYASEAISPNKSARRSFRVRGLAPLVRDESLPEGLYRVRVVAWAGATNITREPKEDEEPSNVSEYFWIKDEGSDEPPSPPTRDRYVASYLEARREVQWALLAGRRDPWSLPACIRSWDGTPDGRASQGTCALQFGRQTFRVRVSNLLRRIEGQILAKPEALGAFRAELAYGAHPRDVRIAPRSDVPNLTPDDPFLVARRNLFSKIRGEDGQGTVETTDLLALREEIVAYVREYVNLIGYAEGSVAQDSQRWPETVGLATLDAIRLNLPGLSERTSVAILLSPTHPLRLLWSLQLALVGEAWLREAHGRGSAETLTAELRGALQGGLQPTNLPPVLFDRRRVGYLEAGQVAPGWDVYLPADIADKRSALARLARALSSGTWSSTSEARVSGLSARILRYIRQHPYVGQLRLNVFNPGDGALVVELLSKLDQSHPDLRYDIRLFSDEDEVRDDLGTALDQLVNPETTIDEAAEKYSQSGKHALHPNLRYSKNRVTDFLAEPERHQAHLSIVLDLFRPRIDVAAPFTGQPGSGLFGLAQEQAERCLGGQGAFAWERQVIAGPVPESAPGADEAALLGKALAITQTFVAALGASPAASAGRVPTVRLDLTVRGQNLLFEIHRVSDWVLTLDRHLGIDYFDSAGPGEPQNSSAILLDFSPEFPTTDQAVLMLTTRVDEEIDRLVLPVLERLGLDEPGCSRRVIDWLRSLSGRLAMRLLSTPLDSEGVVGMALARAFLGSLGLLQDSLIIPVDAHAQLLQVGLDADEARSRTDLILAHLGPGTRQLELSLVEVKCRAGRLTPSAYHELHDEMAAQIAQTQAALTRLFDPTAQQPDRLDRPLRNQVLARWLRFYVGRARRYRLLSPEAEQALRELIADLDGGYALSFRQTGIVFELGRDEDDVEDASGDLTIHRVGRRSCQQFLRGDEGSSPPTRDRIRQTIRGDFWTRPSASPSTSTAPADKAQTETSSRGPQAGPVSLAGETEHVARRRPVECTASEDGAETASPGEARAPSGTKEPTCHYLVGDTKVTPQWGIIGRYGGDAVALDLNGCNTLSLFGVQGGGKSYTMGTILEMALRPLPGLNVLRRPLAAVVFHYNESQDYAPEFVTMSEPNRVAAEVARLREEYGGEPEALEDILILSTEDKIAARQREFPGMKVEPIAFHPGELTIQDWRFLMGAVGNDSLYIRELNLAMRSLRDNITVEGLRQAVEASGLSDSQRKLARLRLRFAEQFVREGLRLSDKLHPGRLIIVDLRDELVETDEALGLFVVMLRVFAGATHEGRAFSKWIAFDEAHKYIRNPDLVDSVVEVIRQMRHQATSVLIASQDPPSLPLKVVELSSLVMLHRMDSPNWLKHIQRAITALGDLTAPALARLRPGEAYLWARSATDPLFTHRALKIQCRPRATQHGGATKAATDA